MPTDTTVKCIHSAMPGAPTLTNTAGSLIGLFDACLVNGFGTGNVDSIVIAGGIATVTRAAGHPFTVDAVDSVALIAGANVTGGTINGERKVLASPAPTSTTYCFDATGVPNQTATTTGTITHKVAPLGYQKLFTGANLAAYKPGDPAATGCVLRVDDTGTTVARVIGFETMSDINTGTGQFPTTAQLNAGGYFPKSNAVAGNRPWMLIGDGRIFYFMSAWNSGNTNYGIPFAFGDINALKSPDPYAAVLFAPDSDYSGVQPGNTLASELSHSSGSTRVGCFFAPRQYTGLGGSIPLGRSMPSPVGGGPGISGTASWVLPYPSPTDGGLYVAPMFVPETSGVLRGSMPGFWPVPQAVGGTAFVTRDRVTGIAGMAGRVMRAVTLAGGVAFFDVTGPWR